MKTITIALIIIMCWAEYASAQLNRLPPGLNDSTLLRIKNLNSLISYPQAAIDSGFQEILYLSLLIDDNGGIVEIVAHNEVNSSFLSHSQYVVRLLQFTPAMQYGATVRAIVNTAFRYCIDSLCPEYDITSFKNFKKTYTGLVFYRPPFEFRPQDNGWNIYTMFPELMPVYEERKLEGHRALRSDFDKKFENAAEAMKGEDWLKAVNYFDEIYRGGVENPDYLFNRAHCNFKLGNLKAACKDWKRAKNLGDEESKILYDKQCQKKR